MKKLILCITVLGISSTALAFDEAEAVFEEGQTLNRLFKEYDTAEKKAEELQIPAAAAQETPQTSLTGSLVTLLSRAKQITAGIRGIATHTKTAMTKLNDVVSEMKRLSHQFRIAENNREKLYLITRMTNQTIISLNAVMDFMIALSAEFIKPVSKDAYEAAVGISTDLGVIQAALRSMNEFLGNVLQPYKEAVEAEEAEQAA